MKFRIAVLACALASSVALAAPPDPAAQNAAKEKEIAGLLVDKLGKDAETIRVTVVGEKITLTGQVADRGTQELSAEVVKFADPKAKIDNQLKSTTEKSFGKGKTEDEIADNKLEKHVREKVKAELGAHYKVLQIECTAGTCTVRGDVPDQTRKDLAMKAAGGVEGVKKAVDLLRIKG